MEQGAEEAQARLREGVRWSELYLMLIGVALAAGGALWVYLESGASTRYYVFRLIPASWTVLVIGVLLIVGGAFTYLQALRSPKTRISPDGVRSGTEFIPWSDVDRTYFGGTRGDGWDIRTIRVVAKDGRQIELQYSFSSSMSEVDEQAFADLRASVLQHVGARLWTELAELLNAGGKYEFLPGVFVAGEGFVEADGGRLLPWSHIEGYEVLKGSLNVTYRDAQGGGRAWQVGDIAQAANFDILCTLLDRMIPQQQPAQQPQQPVQQPQRAGM